MATPIPAKAVLEFTPRPRTLPTIGDRDIFREGKAAKADGRPDAANPYEAGSQQSADWLAGYTSDEPEPSAAGPDTDL